MREPDLWESDLTAFMHPQWNVAVFSEPWFVNVAVPMRSAWEQRKNFEVSSGLLHQAPASDWTVAGHEWLERYHARRAAAPQDHG
jgi:hypothetical protein